MSLTDFRDPTKCPCCGWRTYNEVSGWCLDCGKLKQCARCRITKGKSEYLTSSDRFCKTCKGASGFANRCSQCSIGCSGELCRNCKASEDEAAKVTPEMIREACEAIRAGWTDRETIQRAAPCDRPIPVDVRCSDERSGRRKSKGSDVKAGVG